MSFLLLFPNEVKNFLGEIQLKLLLSTTEGSWISIHRYSAVASTLHDFPSYPPRASGEPPS